MEQKKVFLFYMALLIIIPCLVYKKSDNLSKSVNSMVITSIIIFALYQLNKNRIY